jgi:hypothetical protein
VTMVTMGMNKGAYTYNPPLNFSGLDTFTYTVSDGVNPPVTATVHITVLPLANPDTGTTLINTVLNGSSVLSNDIGAGLSINSYNTTTVQGGTVVMNSNGTYTYTPPLNFAGIDSFRYTLQDGAGSLSTTTVVIDVLPQAQPDAYITYENTPLNGSSVLANDQPTTVIVVGVSSTTVPGSSVTMFANGTFLYIPPPNYFGQDSFTYTTRDSAGDMTSAVVTITILNVYPPVPTNFVGTIDKCKLLNKTEYKLKATWSESISLLVGSYRIYRNGVLVKEIGVGSPLIFEKCAKSKSALTGYEISAVSFQGDETARLKLRIVNE